MLFIKPKKWHKKDQCTSSNVDRELYNELEFDRDEYAIFRCHCHIHIEIKTKLLNEAPHFDMK